MKLRSPWMTAGWILTILIIFAQIMIQLGRQEVSSNPSIYNDGPSGCHAFSRLLSQFGYTVRSTRSVGRRIQPDELAIAVPTRRESAWVSNLERDTTDPYTRFVSRHLESGGDLLMLFVDLDFPGVSSQSRTTSSQFNGPSDEILSTSGLIEDDLFNSSNSRTLVAHPTIGPIVWWQDVGAGRVYFARGGLFATNRFIDKNDNAAYLLQVVRTAARDRKKIVFLEAAHSSAQEESITALIGPWAVGAWTQILIGFLCAVVVLGIRFGLPSDQRFQQRGTRELVDALADMLGRTKSSHVALDQILKSNDLMVRRRLKIPQDASNEVRDKQLPDALAKLFWEAEQAVETKADRGICLSIARKLDFDCHQLVGKKVDSSAKFRRRSKN